MIRHFFSLVCMCVFFQHTNAQTVPVSVIPEPVQLNEKKGVFVPDAQTTIVVSTSDSSLYPLARHFAEWITPATGYTLKLVHDKPVGKYIRLSLDATAKDLKTSEGYKLSVTEYGIQLSAQKAAGIFYGLQTLRQLFPASIESKTLQKGTSWSVPCTEITDYPRFAWRGLLLDVSRHFFFKGICFKIY